jgi:hypothetical protein
MALQILVDRLQVIRWVIRFFQLSGVTFRLLECVVSLPKVSYIRPKVRGGHRLPQVLGRERWHGVKGVQNFPFALQKPFRLHELHPILQD